MNDDKIVQKIIQFLKKQGLNQKDRYLAIDKLAEVLKTELHFGRIPDIDKPKQKSKPKPKPKPKKKKEEDYIEVDDLDDELNDDEDDDLDDELNDDEDDDLDDLDDEDDDF